MSIAFVFPGQGAQTIGMGKALADAYPAAKAVFDEVDDALGQKLSTLIWDGEIEELTLTENAQPALMATSLAAMAALKAEGKYKVYAIFCYVDCYNERPLWRNIFPMLYSTLKDMLSYCKFLNIFFNIKSLHRLSCYV